jgi:glycosyltransferase involved in cell wall biosynthesis
VRLRRGVALTERLRRICLRLSVAMAAVSDISRGELSHAKSLFSIANQRGPLFASRLADAIQRTSHPLLGHLVERATRTNLLPGGQLARVRAAALSKRTGASYAVDAKVALVLAPQQQSRRPAAPFEPPHLIAGRRYIVVGSISNPYVQIINSQLESVGLTVHYVSGFAGVLDALIKAQSAGEVPHVHLDTWLTRSDAAELVATLQPTSTLSVTAHDLEQNQSLQQRSTGASLLLARANAIHLLTASTLTRLGFERLAIDPRVFHVPHPSYYGPFGGSYSLPQDRTQARQQLQRDPAEFSVGLVGRISDRKNVELLIDAAETLHKMHGFLQQPRIYISGSLRTKFAERIIRRSAALPNVVLVTDDLDDEVAGLHIAALNAAVVPYYGYLNSGWTLLALSAGIPVIASRESTAREVVPADALVEYTEGDAHSLAEAILSLAGRDLTVAEIAARNGANLVHPNHIARLYADEMAARIFHA